MNFGCTCTAFIGNNLDRLAVSFSRFSSTVVILLEIMKFAHEYEAALKQEGYPDSWVQSAISYRQLKKCIKKVQRELSSIGLDAETLEQLWRSLKTSNINGAPFQYKFEGWLFK